MKPSLDLPPREVEELVSYAYSYPHKSSYRRLSPPVPLRVAWCNEDVNGLALYVHVPFCEMRCGFCNLFTQSRPRSDEVTEYLGTLRRQMRVARESVPDARIAQFAVGGGTPTFLSGAQLESLLADVQDAFGFRIRDVPVSVETSPATATDDRLDVLRDSGVERISLGVQSFVEEETGGIGRPQRPAEVHRAAEAIRARGFPVLNVDLIYGAPAQSRATWLASLREALRYSPEELYLYPLYVRPETGLARAGRGAAENRRDLYREARDLLGAEGYAAASLRCFRRAKATPSAHACQRDGMLGLGCGARSYTDRLHYATRFAVRPAGVRAILRGWVGQSDEELALATHGIWLSDEERRRRFLILSLLQAEGLRRADYAHRFAADPLDDLPDLWTLHERGWLRLEDERIALTAAGLERSDEIGPMLYSNAVRERLREFTRL